MNERQPRYFLQLKSQEFVTAARAMGCSNARMIREHLLPNCIGQLVATAMLHAAASRGLDLDAFVVRKAAKDHGMKRRVEGPDVAGRNVVVLEDTSTTGGSPLEAVAALREAGANVLAVAVIVDRATGARERIEAAGLPYYAALGLADLELD